MFRDKQAKKNTTKLSYLNKCNKSIALISNLSTKLPIHNLNNFKLKLIIFYLFIFPKRKISIKFVNCFYRNPSKSIVQKVKYD